MKPIIPFLILGSIGAVGVVSDVRGTGGGTAIPVDPPPTVTVTTTGPVTVKASFERTTLPANQEGDTFVRVAITGLAQQKDATTQQLPVSLTLVIDRSGSMGSEHKMETAKDAACKAVQALSPGDRFAVVSFDNGAEQLATGDVVPATVQRACLAISGLDARGSTDMAAGLDVGTQAARTIAGSGRINRLLLLSDGRPDSEAGLAERTAALARAGVVTTTIGLGTDYNEDLMASIADRGLGNTWFVESQPEKRGGTTLASIFQTELSSMADVVAKGTVLRLTEQDGLQVADVIGFPHDRSGHDVIVPIGDVYAGHTTDLLVRVRHPAARGDHHLLDVAVSGTATRSTRDPGAAGDDAFGTVVALNADFSADSAVVAAALVPEVAEEAEEWRTTQALLVANEAYNRGDFGGGDAILNEQKAKVQVQAKALGSSKLEALFSDVDSYQQQNQLGGLSTRASMNKVAKEKARDYQRGSKKGQ
jgi:Ca-activated chloride channel family protein